MIKPSEKEKDSVWMDVIIQNMRANLITQQRASYACSESLFIVLS